MWDSSDTRDSDGRRTYDEATINGIRITATVGDAMEWDQRQHAKMLGCGAPAHIWRPGGVPFWRHARGTSCNRRCEIRPLTGGESENHKTFKEDLSALWNRERFWTSPEADTVTIPIHNGYRPYRRPDALSRPTTKPQKLRRGEIPYRVQTVHEVQASHSTLDEFDQRWKDYQSAGYATVAYALPGSGFDLPRTMNVFHVDQSARLSGVLTRIDEIDPEFIDPTDVDKAVHQMAQGQWLRTDYGLVTKEAWQRLQDEADTERHRRLDRQRRQVEERRSAAARICTDSGHLNAYQAQLPILTRSQQRTDQRTDQRTPADIIRPTARLPKPCPKCGLQRPCGWASKTADTTICPYARGTN